MQSYLFLSKWILKILLPMIKLDFLDKWHDGIQMLRNSISIETYQVVGGQITVLRGGVGETWTSGIHSKCKTSWVINSNIRGSLLFMLWISHTCSAPSLDLLLNPFLFRLRKVCCNNVQKTVSDTAFASACKYPSWMKPFVVSLQKWKLSDCLCNSRWCLFQTWKYWFRERTAQLQ